MIKLQEESERKNQVIVEQDELNNSFALMKKKLEEELGLYNGIEEKTFEASITRGF